MVLRSGEVLGAGCRSPRAARRAGRAAPLLRHDGRLRVARARSRDQGSADEVRDQRRGVGRRCDHVEVAERLAAAAHAPGAETSTAAGAREALHDLAYDRQPDTEEAAPLRLSGRSPSREPGGSAPRSSRRAPEARGRAAAGPPGAARRASSRRARARSAPRSSGRAPAAARTDAPPRHLGAPLLEARPSSRSRSSRRSSTRSSRRSPGAPSPCPAAQAEQDIRRMGGLGRALPYTKWVFLAGSLALVGIPPFVGLLLEGRDHRGAARPRRRARLLPLRLLPRRRVPDRPLHVPAVLHRLRRRAVRRSRASTCTSRTAGSKGPLSMVWTGRRARRARDVRRLDPVRAVLGADRRTGSTRSPRR